MTRLDEQISWYDDKSKRCQRIFKWVKGLEIVAAAAIPVLAAAGFSKWVLAVLGGLIVAAEGLQQMNQYHELWITYRSTAEALKHDKYLHAAKAGPYADAADPDRLLAERVEGLVSQEHAKWAATREQSGKTQPGAPSTS